MDFEIFKRSFFVLEQVIISTRELLGAQILMYSLSKKEIQQLCGDKYIIPGVTHSIQFEK